ncbi:haloalkane dehalogenase [Pseudonocardia acaciae]|uniref:haloalkane dehalogenase n=1 Tax=Pseudonocardia acaciae TaxID=551276 RepID=UPI00048C1D89|nr:haloalkane dehalogenase [Pseudonocardia acaciae]
MAEIEVLGSRMAFVEAGAGSAPVVFLHGNPTSSYLWRNVIPRVSGDARCLAPDLIGMGGSGRPDIEYRFADHARYLDGWFDALGLAEVVLVGHDWGGSLAMDWAARHPERVRGLVVVETFLRPMSWAEYPPAAVGFFRDMRTPGVGERMVLEENWFVEKALPLTVPGLAEADLDVYRAAYPDPESRRPLLRWPREIPLDGEPADVAERMVAYGRWLATSPGVPKLLLTVEPGQLVPAEGVAWAREHIAGLEVESLGEAGHHVPEEHPERLGDAVAGFLRRHRP